MKIIYIKKKGIDVLDSYNIQYYNHLIKNLVWSFM